MLKISVITVCLNAAHLLRKTIESVLEQSFEQVEYIIIDGCSEDDSVQVVRSYGNRIQKFISEPDKGLYDAMNKGIQLAEGDLIIFLNAGDFFVSKDALRFYINRMNLQDADLFFARIVWNEERNKVIGLSDHHNTQFTWDLKASNFPHPATVYKKSLFYTLGLFDLQYPIAADYEWNVRALVANKIRFQYIDIIITVFYADGISNKPEFAARHRQEIAAINEQYFRPKKLYDAIAGNKYLQGSPFVKKLINKRWKTRLARVYH